MTFERFMPSSLILLTISVSTFSRGDCAKAGADAIQRRATRFRVASRRVRMAFSTLDAEYVPRFRGEGPSGSERIMSCPPLVCQQFLANSLVPNPQRQRGE